MSHTELVVGKRKAWVDLSEFEFDEPLLPSRVPPTVTLVRIACDCIALHSRL